MNNQCLEKTGKFIDFQILMDKLLLSIGYLYTNKDIVLKPVLPKNFALADAYIHSFPQLVLYFNGDHDHPNTSCEKDLLSPACCYPLFHYLSDSKFEEKQLFTTKSYVFRNEDSFEEWVREPVFTVREFVLFGKENQVLDWIQLVSEHFPQILTQLGLEVKIEEAADAFFNPKSLQSQFQSYYKLKQELRVNDIAIASINNHKNIFNRKCSIHLEDEPAFSACFALGYNRIWHVLTEKYGVEESLQKLESLLETISNN
ncbi:hypothetical protein [Cytobacillus pseudoceanisediminis]|uniref:hypothetical protein n=1 Tax=Cytobacillus pseudoceanisediminis TaxID=3051614 RepID=UPI003C2D4C50